MSCTNYHLGNFFQKVCTPCFQGPYCSIFTFLCFLDNCLSFIFLLLYRLSFTASYYPVHISNLFLNFIQYFLDQIYMSSLFVRQIRLIWHIIFHLLLKKHVHTIFWTLSWGTFTGTLWIGDTTFPGLIWHVIWTAHDHWLTILTAPIRSTTMTSWSVKQGWCFTGIY